MAPSSPRRRHTPSPSFGPLAIKHHRFLSRLAEPARAVPVAAAPRVAEASRPAAAPFSDSLGERDAGRVRRSGCGFRRQARRVVRRVSRQITRALPDVIVLVDDGRLRSADAASDPMRFREQRVAACVEIKFYGAFVLNHDDRGRRGAQQLLGQPLHLSHHDSSGHSDQDCRDNRSEKWCPKDTAASGARTRYLVAKRAA